MKRAPLRSFSHGDLCSSTKIKPPIAKVIIRKKNTFDGVDEVQMFEFKTFKPSLICFLP